jgi:two-component system, cell cycle response regulator
MEQREPANHADANAPKPCILVVDDEPRVRHLLQTVLERADYRVIAAAKAEDALAAASGQDVALAIVDINLTDSSGFQLCRRLRDEHGIEIILITGAGQTYSYEDAFRSGAIDFIVKPLNTRELVLRSERAVQFRYIREARDRSMKELQILSSTDSLTGLSNSRHFFHQLKAELARAERYAHHVSLVLLDLDNFKMHNDTYGHQEGDRALREVGGIIRSCIRESDSAYRYGGEEFTIILPETDSEAALPVAERLLTAIGSADFGSAAGDIVRLTASIGVAQWRVGEDMDALLKRADLAMYKSKREGRNRVTVDDGGSATADRQQPEAAGKSNAPATRPDEQVATRAGKERTP